MYGVRTSSGCCGWPRRSRRRRRPDGAGQGGPPGGGGGPRRAPQGYSGGIFFLALLPDGTVLANPQQVNTTELPWPDTGTPAFATVQLGDDSDQPARGDVIRVVPNHVCAAVNLADEYIVVSEGTQIARWEIAARGLNT